MLLVLQLSCTLCVLRIGRGSPPIRASGSLSVQETRLGSRVVFSLRTDLSMFLLLLAGVSSALTEQLHYAMRDETQYEKVPAR